MTTLRSDEQPSNDRIIAEGPKWIRPSEYRRVRDMVRLRYVERMAAARWWQRLWLRLRMRLEVDGELRRFAPPDRPDSGRELR